MWPQSRPGSTVDAGRGSPPFVGAMTSVPATSRHRGGGRRRHSPCCHQIDIACHDVELVTRVTVRRIRPESISASTADVEPVAGITLRSTLRQRAVKSENAESVSDIFIGPIVLERMIAPPPLRIRLSHCPPPCSLAPSSQLRRSRTNCCRCSEPCYILPCCYRRSPESRQNQIGCR
jgi:hypothetical protein